MTALAVHASHASQESHLSWPRVGAWSGSFSLHLIILAMLVVPPVALQVVRQVQRDPVIRLIDPPVKTVEPDLPVPVIHQTVKPIKRETPPPIARVTEETSDMAYTAPQVDFAPPAIHDAPAVAVDTEPSAITYGKQTRVAYPRESLRNREQGTVVLRVLVGADGVPQAVEIEKTSGWPRLDRAARDAVKGWSFHAAMRNGVAHSAWALVPVTFNLQTL